MINLISNPTLMVVYTKIVAITKTSKRDEFTNHEFALNVGICYSLATLLSNRIKKNQNKRYTACNLEKIK